MAKWMIVNKRSTLSVSEWSPPLFHYHEQSLMRFHIFPWIAIMKSLIIYALPLEAEPWGKALQKPCGRRRRHWNVDDDDGETKNRTWHDSNKPTNESKASPPNRAWLVKSLQSTRCFSASSLYHSNDRSSLFAIPATIPLSLFSRDRCLRAVVVFMACYSFILPYHAPDKWNE